jgi:hypothetical protein
VLSVWCALVGTLVWAGPAQAAGSFYHVWSATDEEQTFHVPAWVTQIKVVALGGSGADGTGGDGAGAAQVSADLSVTPGQVLYLEVAGGGRETISPNPGFGGFNGGGEGPDNMSGFGAGGGGGATDVRTSPRSAGLAPDSRILVAGGGGGGGGYSSSGSGGNGGPAGAPGADYTSGGHGGGAGGSTTGGAGGSGSNPGVAGRLGSAGNGGTSTNTGGPGGGGGGGYYGGGGGGAGATGGGGGGGGGSSLVPAGGTAAVVGGPGTQGYIEIIWPKPSATQNSDNIAPRISGFRLAAGKFRAASKGSSIAAAAVGTQVSYRVSEAGRAKFTVERAAKGRKKGRRCVAPTTKNRKAHRCTRYLRLKGSFSRTSKSGLNRFRFTGRLRGKKLRPGRYRLAMAVTDAAKNKSKPKRAKFRIVR